MKKIRMDLTKVQAYMTEYCMKEEEYIRETAKANDEIKSMWNARGKYRMEVYQLTRRLKHAKKERKEDATVFELQLRKLRQELKEGEKTWSEAENKFLEEAIQMTTDL